MIKIKQTSVRDEADVPLGASKYKGLPHLPGDRAWPRHHYFLAQLNLVELHPLDIYGAFPESGVLYVFFDPGGEVAVTHYDGPLDRLGIVPYPDSAKSFRGAKYFRRIQKTPVTDQAPASGRLLPRRRRLRPQRHEADPKGSTA
jgi:hypothetical protein